MAKKGIFRPTNPQKYKGNLKEICWRSSWELYAMRLFDNHPDIIQWSSEEIVINYKDPITGRKRRYFPDFWIKKKNKDGTISEEIIEVKPYCQTMEPTPQKIFTRKYLTEVQTYLINKAKWDAAERYCDKVGNTFRIITENELGFKK